jgi:hypothetical protein
LASHSRAAWPVRTDVFEEELLLRCDPGSAAATLANTMALASLGKDLSTSVLINLLGWAASSVLRTDKFFDLLGGVTHVALVLRRVLPWLVARKKAGAALLPAQQTAGADGAGDNRKVAGASAAAAAPPASTRMHPRQLLSSIACCVWAVRLSGFLFVRHGEALLAPGRVPWLGVGDQRFLRVVAMPAQFAKFWGFQASWCFLNLLPVLISNSKTEEELKGKPLNKWDYLGLGMWAGDGAAPLRLSQTKCRLTGSARVGRRDRSRRGLPAGAGCRRAEGAFPPQPCQRRQVDHQRVRAKFCEVSPSAFFRRLWLVGAGRSELG